MITKKKITNQQQRVMRLIISSIEKNHRPPTWSEVSDKLNIQRSAVRDFIDALVKKGELVKVNRGIKLNPKKYTVYICEARI